MEFALSETQTMFQDTTARCVESHMGEEKYRTLLEDAGKRAPLREALVEMGLPGLLVDEEHGGLGASLLDAAVVQQSLGGGCAPVASVGRWALAPMGIALAGTEEARETWLPKIASGEVRMGVALSEQAGARRDAGITASGDKLNGRAVFAMDAEDATHILTADKDGTLFIVAVDDKTVRVKPEHTIDISRGFSSVAFKDAAGERLSGENEPGAACAKLLTAGRILVAADTIGASQHMLAHAVAYAAEREQFGRPIGAFQAVKHMCAEMAAQIEPCHAMLWYAAYVYDKAPQDAPHIACLLKAHVAQVGRFVARTATEVHGGTGFADLSGMHYWFKRIGVNRQLLGGPERLFEEALKLDPAFDSGSS